MMIAKVITKIRTTLKKETDYNGAGISNGILGLSMFYYYQYLYSKDDLFLKETINVLENALEMLSEDYKSISPQNDIIEIGSWIHYLYEQEILDNEAEELLSEFDELIKEILEKRINTHNLDVTTGVFQPLNYFIKRKNNQAQIIRVITLIEEERILEKNNCYWNFQLHTAKKPSIELGLNHGVSGVIYGLLECYKNNIEKERTKNLIVFALRFLETQMNKEKTCWFPQEANSKGFSPYQNLSYGDIGIGFTFYKAGKILHEKKWESLGVLILENAADFKDDSDKYIKDANLIYGASGLYSFFNYMNLKSPNLKFYKSKEYWLNKIIEKGNNNTVWAGYNTYYNGIYDFAQLGFSQGLCGIGISLIANEINNDNAYLEYLNFKL